MKLLCDADVDAPLVQQLRADGHEVSYMQEIHASAPDEEVLALAAANSAVLVTRDKGFGQLVFHRQSLHAGVLLLRLAGLPMSQRRELLSWVFRVHGAELVNSFGVLTREGLRIRPAYPK